MRCHGRNGEPALRSTMLPPSQPMKPGSTPGSSPGLVTYTKHAAPLNQKTERSAALIQNGGVTPFSLPCPPNSLSTATHDVQSACGENMASTFVLLPYSVS